MSAALRIALLHPAPAPSALRALEAGMRAAGHAPSVIAPRPLPRAERLLRARGFTGPLSHLPAAAAALARERFDLAHAFALPDAAAALRWGAWARAPVVFTSLEPLDRSRVADGRLRLRMLETVLAEAAAVTAPDEAVREAFERWLAVAAPVLDPGDADAHERLYRSVLA